jgi:hypothetical protein
VGESLYILILYIRFIFQRYGIIGMGLEVWILEILGLDRDIRYGG